MARHRLLGLWMQSASYVMDADGAGQAFANLPPDLGRAPRWLLDGQMAELTEVQRDQVIDTLAARWGFRCRSLFERIVSEPTHSAGGSGSNHPAEGGQSNSEKQSACDNPSSPEPDSTRP